MKHNGHHPGNPVGHELIRHVKVGSTNEVAMKLAREGAAHGTVVVADSQEHGRGRLGRSWASPAGLNIYMSVVLRPEAMAALNDAPGLVPLAAGLASARAVERATGVEVSLKWPNDLMVDGRKLGGILVEGRASSSGTEYAVLGIGININAAKEDFPEEIHEIATSLFMLTARKYHIEDILRHLITELGRSLSMTATPEERRRLLEDYREACITLNREVRADTGEGVIEGLASDIDTLGRLVISSDGKTQAISSADITHLG